MEDQICPAICHLAITEEVMGSESSDFLNGHSRFSHGQWVRFCTLHGVWELARLSRWNERLDLSSFELRQWARPLTMVTDSEMRQKPARCRGWHGVEPLSSNQGNVCVMRATYEIKLFTEALHWAQRRFHTNGFHWDECMQTEPWYARNRDETAHFLATLVSRFWLGNVSRTPNHSMLCTSTDSFFKTYLSKGRHLQRESNL